VTRGVYVEKNGVDVEGIDWMSHNQKRERERTGGGLGRLGHEIGQ
jgi:hypothetical protein